MQQTPALATACYREALPSLGPDELPLEEALLRHAVGRMLVSRANRREGLGEPRTAHEILSRLGARSYLDRVERDLAASDITSSASPSPPALTEREHDVATHLAKGMTERDLAAELSVSSNTSTTTYATCTRSPLWAQGESSRRSSPPGSDRAARIAHDYAVRVGCRRGLAVTMGVWASPT